jgi:hypothetical protein
VLNNRKWLQKILSLWPILVALASGASATYAWVSSRVDNRIEAEIKAHDRELHDASHPAIQTRLEALEDYWKAHTSETNRIHGRINKAEKELYELYWFLVGDKAAAAERNPDHRAQAARQARERFRVYVRDGEGLKDAYRHALESSIPR